MISWLSKENDSYSEYNSSTTVAKTKTPPPQRHQRKSPPPSVAFSLFVELFSVLDVVTVVMLYATRGVTVNMSAFLACHQCYYAGSSLAWGLNLRVVVCGIF